MIKNISRITIYFILLVGFAFLFSSCKKEIPPVRIGMTLWPGYELLYLAEKKGYFRDEKINIKLYDFVSLSDSRRAFEREQIDVVCGTISELLIIRENSDKSPQAFFVVDFSDGADVILARKPVESIADLKGKRVGAELMSMDILTLYMALKKYQMNLSDITLVPMSQNSMTSCYEKNEVDALCTYPPASVKIQNLGNAVKLFDSSEIPGYIIDLLIADLSFIESRPEDLAKIIRCIDRAIQYLKDKPEDALSLIAEHEQITVNELQESYNGISLLSLKEQGQYFRDNGQLFRAAVAANEILKETGVIQQTFRAEDVFNTVPVNMALSKHPGR